MLQFVMDMIFKWHIRDGWTVHHHIVARSYWKEVELREEIFEWLRENYGNRWRMTTVSTTEAIRLAATAYEKGGVGRRRSDRNFHFSRRADAVIFILFWGGEVR